MADSSSVAPDIDSELSEAEIRESQTRIVLLLVRVLREIEGEVAIMSVLRCPPLSVISRKRKLRANHPPTGKY